MVFVDGVTAIDVSVAVVPVNVVEPVMLFSDALIDVVPVATTVAMPRVPFVFEIVATLVVDEAHATADEMFLVDPSMNVPVATNWML